MEGRCPSESGRPASSLEVNGALRVGEERKVVAACGSLRSIRMMHCDLGANFS